jgi:hypothetical protein
MPFFAADLHIHTVLSACAEAEMLPDLIVARAQEEGLDLIAVTDHNSAENAAAVIRAGQGTGIVVWPGMEVQSREEVHLLCLFDTLEQALRWQETVYASLPPLKNRPEIFGEQVVLAADGEPIGYNERLLATSTSLSVEEVVRGVRALGGLCVPAHVDRPMYSIIANLGFIPADLDIPGVEISHPLPATGALRADCGQRCAPIERDPPAHHHQSDASHRGGAGAGAGRRGRARGVGGWGEFNKDRGLGIRDWGLGIGRGAVVG